MSRKRKVSEKDCETIRWYYNTNYYWSLEKLGRKYGVSPTTINNIIERKGAYSDDKQKPKNQG